MTKAQSSKVEVVAVEVDETASRRRPFAQLSTGERIGRELLQSVVRIDALRPSGENVRTHSDRNIDAIKRSLTKFGQQSAIVYSALTGEVLVGNGRLAAMQSLGWAVCAAMAFDGTPDEARAYAIADNRTAELADWDWRGLSGQLRDLIDGGVFSGDDLGFNEHDLSPLLNASWRPDDVVDLETMKKDTASTGDDDDDDDEQDDARAVAFSPELFRIVRRAIARVRELDGETYDDAMAIAEICRRFESANL
jgi:hypothetical protein